MIDLFKLAFLLGFGVAGAMLYREFMRLKEIEKQHKLEKENQFLTNETNEHIKNIKELSLESLVDLANKQRK